MAAELLLYRRQSRSNSDAQRAIDTGKSASDEKAESEWDPSQLTRIDKHKGVSRYLSGETSHELTSGESARILCRQKRTDHDIAWNSHNVLRLRHSPSAWTYFSDTCFSIDNQRS